MWRVLRLAAFLLLALVAYDWWATHEAVQPGPGPAPSRQLATGDVPSFLPPEAVETLRTIERGGPFPYDRDGTEFRNREGRLPPRPPGYYREYTVRTPGAADRGARRIVTGGDPPEVVYYTDDHYRSFRPVERRP